MCCACGGTTAAVGSTSDVNDLVRGVEGPTAMTANDGTDIGATGGLFGGPPSTACGKERDRHGIGEAARIGDAPREGPGVKR